MWFYLLANTNKKRYKWITSIYPDQYIPNVQIWMNSKIRCYFSPKCRSSHTTGTIYLQILSSCDLSKRRMLPLQRERLILNYIVSVELFWEQTHWKRTIIRNEISPLEVHKRTEIQNRNPHFRIFNFQNQLSNVYIYIPFTCTSSMIYFY